MDGKCLQMTDLYPAMTESGILGEEGIVFENIHVDAAGNYYLIGNSRPGEILLLGEDGAMQEWLTVGSDDSIVQFCMKDPDGNPIFECCQSGEALIRLVTYIPASGLKTYASAKLTPGVPKALSADGYLYYLDLNVKPPDR